jgi:dTDP-glucose pyrophosphorylase
MNEELRVYEFDTEELITRLQDQLIDRGYDVREQTPQGVWWIATDKSRDDAATEISGLLRDLIAERLCAVRP